MYGSELFARFAAIEQYLQCWIYMTVLKSIENTVDMMVFEGNIKLDY